MQELSFTFDQPQFTFGGFTFSVQIFTYENVYGLLKDAEVIHRGEQELEVRSNGLTRAGGQERSQGSCAACFRMDPVSGAVQVDMRASHPHKIRCLKLIVFNLPRLAVLNLRSGIPAAIPDDGLILNYPEGWRELATPLIVFDQDARGRFPYVRSLDRQVREKRIAIIPHGDAMDVELIWEEDAIRQTTVAVAPTWEIGAAANSGEIHASQMELAETAYGLEPWETRKDVPDWARKIGLVVAIHMQHYTGYVFNDYAQALEVANWFAVRFPAEKTLFYLPGWEGRYYWQYGDYRPDDRMGGERGFGQLVDGIHRLGGHVMPMFGMNVVNKASPSFEQWGRPSQRVNASGNVCEGSVDWDGSRDYDLGWGAMLNPGAPGWQNRLLDQISSLREQFGFRAAFLDISASWWNDPNFHVYDGTVELIRRLRRGAGDFLIGGEAWYDAMGACTPLVQCGHTDGHMNWPDVPYGPAFSKYCRAFAHLSLGDPGRFSTGVHELGTNPIWKTPSRPGIIPTVTIVDGSLEQGMGRIEEILMQAKVYASQPA